MTAKIVSAYQGMAAYARAALCLCALDPASVFVRERMNGVLGGAIGENTLLAICAV
jgi:hypothetical protein